MDTATTAYPVPQDFAQNSNLTPEGYRSLYERSVSDREGFFKEQGARVHWMTPPTHVCDYSFTAPVKIEWYKDGVLNVTESCLDRHLETQGDKVAIIFEGDEPGQSQTFTYREVHAAVCRFANVLKANGAKIGDRITLYMPMIPEAAFAMLACARIGAIHSVVFGGFSPDALAGRIVDCDSHIVITADQGLRGGRKIGLKVNADAACDIAAKAGVTVKTQIVIQIQSVLNYQFEILKANINIAKRHAVAIHDQL